MGKTYTGVSGIAQEVNKIYAGVNGVARQVKKAYVGDSNGIARLVYSAEPDKLWLIQDGYNIIDFYELAYYGDTTYKKFGRYNNPNLDIGYHLELDCQSGSSSGNRGVYTIITPNTLNNIGNKKLYIDFCTIIGSSGGTLRFITGYTDNYIFLKSGYNTNDFVPTYCTEIYRATDAVERTTLSFQLDSNIEGNYMYLSILQRTRPYKVSYLYVFNMWIE